MTGREFRRLSRKELLQMLIVQCEEADRLQKEADAANARLKELEESYERLKIKLNVKDERLNQKDAKIMELNGMIEDMQMAKVVEWRESGAVVDAALLLEGIFKMIQRNAGNATGNASNFVTAGNATGNASSFVTNGKAMGNASNFVTAGTVETKVPANNIVTMRTAGTIESTPKAEEPILLAAAGDRHG